MAYERVKALLDRAGVSYTVHEHEAVTTIDDAEQKVPHLTRNLLKTVVFENKGDGWVLAAVSRRARIHYKYLSDAVGKKRTELRCVAPDKIFESTGFPLGGVGPFAVRDDISVVIDERLTATGRILCGSGRNDRTIEIELEDLCHLPGARVYPIS